MLEFAFFSHSWFYFPLFFIQNPREPTVFRITPSKQKQRRNKCSKKLKNKTTVSNKTQLLLYSISYALLFVSAFSSWLHCLRAMSMGLWFLEIVCSGWSCRIDQVWHHMGEEIWKCVVTYVRVLSTEPHEANRMLITYVRVWSPQATPCL